MKNESIVLEALSGENKIPDMNKKKSGGPGEVPPPEEKPEIQPDTEPDYPITPEEKPEIVPEQEPDEPSPSEIPIPKKGQ